MRIRHYAQQNDPVKVHMWGITLQNELNEVCSDFGLEKMELMNEFDYTDLPRFADHANALEAQMRNIITQNGGVIRDYRTVGEFLHEV